jgi:hypothetical protein
MRIEDEFLQIAHAHGIELERQVSVAGLTGRGPEEEALDARLDATVRHTLQQAHALLGGDSSRLRLKRSIPLRFDFHDSAGGLFVELDEVQHFTTDRGRTLELYPSGSAPAGYPSMVDRWSASADRYRAAKPAADFPRAGGRRAQRAWLDMVRDLAAPALGLKLIRVAAPERDAATAFERYLALRPTSSRAITEGPCAGTA